MISQMRIPHRTLRPVGAVVAFIWATAAVFAQESVASGILSMAVNDSSTHYSVSALIKGDGPESFSAWTDDRGLLKRALPPGEYRLEVLAKGYKPMRSRATVRAGETLSTGFVLTPLHPNEEEQLRDSRIRPGFTLVHGYAIEGYGRPAPGVRVRLQKAGVETTTNDRGYYWLSAPTPPRPVGGRPGTDTLIATKPGYKTIIRRNIMLSPEETSGRILGMEPGKGVMEFDDTHKLMRDGLDDIEESPQTPPGAAKALSPGLYEWLGAPGTAFEVGSHLKSNAFLPQAVTVPTTIRVGLACQDPSRLRTCQPCSWNSCNSAEDFDLENYVRIGLSQEWIAWWALDSLKAGAVAYRSYGSYWVANPIRTDFDICSSSACQKFDPELKRIDKRVKDAQAATAGIILSSDGVMPFFAEYAAESNLASDTHATCPDGQVGEPNNPNGSWPCMKDFGWHIGDSHRIVILRGRSGPHRAQWATHRVSDGEPCGCGGHAAGSPAD